MSILAPSSDHLLRIPMHRKEIRQRLPKKILSLNMKEGPLASSKDQTNEAPTVPKLKISSAPSDLRFDRLQPSDEDCDCKHRRAFGRFVAREALLDEEYWAAAWLRAESNWEGRLNARYVESYKRQFAEQEFTALKRRCNTQHTEKCTCIITVKKEEANVKRTVLNSIVGTLDINIRRLMCGETFPGERLRATNLSTYRSDQPRYAYVANLCVAKYARRQGIARNMLLLASEAAISCGVDQIFVHVHKDNKAAKKLYDTMGFEVVGVAPSCSIEEQNCLLCFKT